MNEINICLSSDDNYSVYAGVVIASILANAALDEKLKFYILDGGISNLKKDEINSLKSIKNCEIDFIKIDENLFEDYKAVKTHSYISFATYYRLKLSSLLPDVKKIIYLDCDTIVNTGLREIFDCNIDEYYIAGVLDMNKNIRKKYNPTFVNAGVIVFNLEKIRNENIENKFLDWTKKNIDDIKMGDQTIINEVCRGKVKILDDSWNVQSGSFIDRSSFTNKPKIVHYVGKRKPWQGISLSPHCVLYFKYLQMTPWKLDDEKYKNMTKDKKIETLGEYFKCHPTFFLRWKFYDALCKIFVENLKK